MFTTNLGIRDRDGNILVSHRMAMDEGPEAVRAKIHAAIRSFFYGIQRPEIYNRLAQNIVVFDFISPEVATEILERHLDRFLTRLASDHDIELTLEAKAVAALADHCLADLDLGGRAIVRRFEDALETPIARKIFERLVEGESGAARWTVTDLYPIAGGFEVEIV